MTLFSSLNNNDFCFDTAKFSVRLLAASDLVLYRKLFCNQHVMQWVGEPLTKVQANASFAAALHHNISAMTELQQGSRIFLLIEDRPSARGVGLMAVTFILADAVAATSGQQPSAAVGKATFDAELGIMLLPSAQKAGLANAAFGSLCQKLRLIPNVNALICDIAEHNWAAKKLVSRLGFVYCKRRNYYQLPINN